MCRQIISPLSAGQQKPGIMTTQGVSSEGLKRMARIAAGIAGDRGERSLCRQSAFFAGLSEATAHPQSSGRAQIHACSIHGHRCALTLGQQAVLYSSVLGSWHWSS